MFLHYSPFWLRALYPGFLWRVASSKENIYLTFDDGPIPDITEFVLDTLKTYHAKATFFCIGDNVRKHPTIYARLKQQGHAVGNHTYNHLNGWKTPDEDYLTNIDACASQLGVETRLFRPPYGRIKRSQAKIVLKQRQIVMWDVLSGDFSKDITPERCLKKTIQYSRSGSIVLFHDSIKAYNNMQYALPRVLDHFTNKGYQFVSLPMH